MVSSTLTTLLSLSALTLAVPFGNKHHFPHGTGMRPNHPHPTGGFPLNGTEGGPFGNSTEGGPFGNGTQTGPFDNSTGAGSGDVTTASGTLVITVTLEPVPEGSDVPDAAEGAGSGSGDFTGPTDVNQGQAASTPAPEVAAPAAGGEGGANPADACNIVTATATATHYVTVTETTEATSSSSGEAVEMAETPAASTLAASTPEAMEASASLVSAVPSVSAGAFYGRPDGGAYGGGYSGAPAASAPTTFATNYGGEPSAPASSAAESPAAPSSNPSPSTGGSSSGGKKGLSYNSASLLSAFDNTGMSWAYNWASAPGGTMPSGIEYVPMCWGLDNGPDIAAAAASATHVLGFNEPDLSSQANIDPQTAAENHIKYLNPLHDAGKQVSSPAITNGAGTSPLMGLDWLSAFFKACGGQCKIDFVAFHWYDSSKNIAYFKQHVQDVVDAASANNIGKVWLTEFGTTDGNSPDFIEQATSFLDQTAAVEKYAYFMVDNILEQGGQLSAAGKAYAA